LAVAGAKRLLAGFAMACCTMGLVSSQADAAWWSLAPADFEECAASAQKNAVSPEDKDKRITACEAKFAGRRKPGGGYTYFDFMQNRHFDIAGPNPTRAEQKYIDEQYAAYLKDQRHSIIAAAFLRKQQQVEQTQIANPTVAKAATDRTMRSGGIRPAAAPKAADKHVAVLPQPRPRIMSPCEKELFSACGWSRISTGMQTLKRVLFGSSPGKHERS
jgi:hypothetical protein